MKEDEEKTFFQKLAEHSDRDENGEYTEEYKKGVVKAARKLNRWLQDYYDSRSSLNPKDKRWKKPIDTDALITVLAHIKEQFYYRL